MSHFPRWKIWLISCACIIFFLLALPNFVSEDTLKKFPAWLPSQTVNLGLDLRGGSHLLLELDFDTYKREQLANLADTVRTKLRAEKLGYKGLTASEGKVLFTVRTEPGQKAPDVTRIIKDINNEIDINQPQPGSYELSFSEEYFKSAKGKLIEQSMEIVNRRVNETGTKEPTIQRQGEDRILLQVPGLQDPQQLKTILGTTAKMTFHMVNMDVSMADMQAGNVPAGTRILPADNPNDKLSNGAPMKYAVFSKVELSGDLLTDSGPTFHQGSPAVSFQFNTEGARKFGDITSKNPGKLFAVVLDDKVITAPRINDAILGGSGVIYGHFTTESANNLALLLRAGALPAPLRIVEERTVGPSLGADSIEAGKHACILGVVLVMGFMLLSYGLFGVFANLALVINVVIILSVLSLFQATLTLPGIAGIVLTLGMAVDANVLIFERIREEVRNGKTPYAAIESGFKMAFTTIFDSNLTTLIAAALLFYFGAGTVKGFAVTLAVGIVSSMFTAITITRLIVALWLERRRPKLLPI